VLRIFTPDVMAYLIDHYQTYSLELTPQHFFIYRDSSSLSQIEGNCESLVAAATDLSTKFFSGVERVHYAENAVVPASVQPKPDCRRLSDMGSCFNEYICMRVRHICNKTDQWRS
jgi:hypothetical protein